MRIPNLFREYLKALWEMKASQRGWWQSMSRFLKRMMMEQSILGRNIWARSMEKELIIINKGISMRDLDMRMRCVGLESCD